MGLDLLAERDTRLSGWDVIGKGRTYPITAGEVHIATLGPELPLEVLAPLRSLNEELMALIASVVRAQVNGATRAGMSSVVLDYLSAYSDLLPKVIDVVTEVGTSLFGTDGFEALVRLRPSTQDVVALVQGVFEWYGLTPGELSGSSTSSDGPDGGQTSTPTSGDTSEDLTSGTHYDSGEIRG